MHPSRRRIEELLWVLGLNRITGPVWEWLRGARAVQQSRRMRDFYSSLLPKNALVFDIGANVGTMTRVFSSLGARVIAVEPIPIVSATSNLLRHDAPSRYCRPPSANKVDSP